MSVFLAYDGNHLFKCICCVYLFFLVEASNFGVKEYFLEDILKLTGFSRMDVSQYKEETQKSMNLS